MEKPKKEVILDILKKGELSTGKISSLISANQYRAEELLEELEKEKKVIKIEKERGVYWRLK